MQVRLFSLSLTKLNKRKKQSNEMKGKYLDNGGAGYILKPWYLIEPKSTFDPLEKRRVLKTLQV
jgi:hypothetical protein